MVKEKVSSKSFFALLYLSLLSSIFMYLSSSQVTMSNTDSVFRPLAFIAFTFVFAIPVFLIIKKQQEMPVNALEERKPLKILAFLYGITYFVAVLRAVARFDLFASCELFSGSDMTYFIMFIVAVCGALSLLGLNALCRAATIFTVVVISATVLVMVSLLGEIDLLNLTPLFRNGAFAFIEECFLFAIQASEIGAIILFLPEIKGDVKNDFKRFVILGGLSFSAIMFFVVASMGAFSDTQLFPTYTAVTLGNFGSLERLDALESAIWILCVVEKIAFYILITVKSLKFAFEKASEKFLTALVCSAVIFVIFVISKDVEKFFIVSSKPIIGFVYFSGVVVLPVALLILKGKGCLREKKNSENN